jgi:UDP-glucuronate 4-epimerase
VELRYLIQLIEQNLGKEARIQTLPDQPGDVPITYADISKARALLNYAPTTNIEQGIENFVQWYKGERN